MEVVEILSPLLGARCTVLLGRRGALAVDPGAATAAAVLAAVARAGVPLCAVLATHGHLDHVWDAGALTAAADVPLVIGAADRYRLDDPFGTLGLPRAALVTAGLDPTTVGVPAHVLTTDDPRAAALLDLGDVVLRTVAAPGHTEGSTLYLVTADDGSTPLVLSGDVLFAGTVGRTDLPGGDPGAMATTLRTVVARLDRSARVLPGHGPATDVATELATNPYLRR